MVFVDRAAEDSSSPHACIDRDDNVRVVVGPVLIQALVWTVAVEMLGVVGQDPSGVLLVVDQNMVGALPADATHEPLRVTVRPRRPRWNLDLYRAKSSVRGRVLLFRVCGYAALRYSLMTPPKIRCRRTAASIATTTSGSWSGGC